MRKEKTERSKFIFFQDKTHLRFDFTISLSSMLLTASLFYLLWEIYWAQEVGYAFIKWHTHLALYFFVWIGLAFILKISNQWFAFKQYAKFQTLLASVAFTLLVLELVLYTTGVGDTYMEHIKAGYASRYNATYETYYRTHEPNEKFYITRPEFNYVRQCNSLGFSDIEWLLAKNKNEKRILIAGDSFTEGVGAPFDSCYPSLLRNLLAAKDSNYYVLNSGISGDDPVVNFVNYRDRLAVYHPDIILQTLSSNDINTDIAVKGGLERFQKNGTIKFPSPPWWEPIYALSYVSRTFFTVIGYNELLIKTPFAEEVKNKLDQKAIAIFSTYAEAAKQNETKFFVLLQPNQGEVIQEHYDYDLSKILVSIRSLDHVYVFDLLPYYVTQFANNKNDISKYYWKQDGHHNSAGYFLMAKGVEQALDSFGLRSELKAKQQK